MNKEGNLKLPYRLISIIVISVVCLVLVGCWDSNQTKIIPDVTKKQTFTLHNKHKGDVVGITIIGKGYIDGEAEITCPSYGGIRRSISGKVDFEEKTDWYANSIDFEYKPTSVKSGNLQLEYYFVNL